MNRDDVNLIFLKIKHWQLFLLFSFPWLLYLCIVLVDYWGHFQHSDIIVISLFCLFDSYWPIILSFSPLVWLFYAYSLMCAFDDRVPSSLKIGRGFALFCFSLPFFFFVTVWLFLFGFLNMLCVPPPIGDGLLLFLFWFDYLFWPLGLLLLFYGVYLLAKTMKIAELQRNVQGKEVLGDFFLFLFFPIGVWFLQPRVNRWVELAEEKRETMVE